MPVARNRSSFATVTTFIICCLSPGGRNFVRGSHGLRSGLALASARDEQEENKRHRTSPAFLASPRAHACAASSSAAFCSSTPDREIRMLPENSGRVVHIATAVDSTQDECRALVRSRAPDAVGAVAVTATRQTGGRGTNGRKWIGRSGNLFLTVAVPINAVPVTPTLLPLKVGVIVASNVRRVLLESSLNERSKVTLKWPNDVLIDDKKIAGVLIENEYQKNYNDGWFLIGIGVNVASAPEIPNVGEERGRPATCLGDHMEGGLDEGSLLRFGESIAGDISTWIFKTVDEKEAESAKILEEWRGFANFGKPLKIRDGPSNEMVIPLDIESDGRLRVLGDNGKERLLAADYLL